MSRSTLRHFSLPYLRQRTVFSPMGGNGMWHGGIHFGPGMEGSLDQRRGVRAILDSSAKSQQTYGAMTRHHHLSSEGRAAIMIERGQGRSTRAIADLLRHSASPKQYPSHEAIYAAIYAHPSGGREQATVLALHREIPPRAPGLNDARQLRTRGAALRSIVKTMRRRDGVRLRPHPRTTANACAAAAAMKRASDPIVTNWNPLSSIRFA